MSNKESEGKTNYDDEKNNAGAIQERAKDRGNLIEVEYTDKR